MQSFKVLILLTLLYLCGVLAQTKVVTVDIVCKTKYNSKSVQRVLTTSNTKNLGTIRVTYTSTTTVVAGTTTAKPYTALSTTTYTPSSATTVVSSTVKTEATTLVSTDTTTFVESTTATESTTESTTTTVTTGLVRMLRGRAVYPTAVCCTEFDVVYSSIIKTVTAKKTVTVTPTSAITRTVTGSPLVATFSTVVTSTTTNTLYSTTVATTSTTTTATTTESSTSTIVETVAPPLRSVYTFSATSSVQDKPPIDLTLTIDRTSTCQAAFDGKTFGGQGIGFKVSAATGTLGTSAISYDRDAVFDSSDNCFFPDDDYHFDYNGFAFGTAEDPNHNLFFDPGNYPLSYFIEGSDTVRFRYAEVVSAE